MKKTETLEQSLKAALADEFGKELGGKIHRELLSIEDYKLSTALFGREVVFDDLPALGRQCLHEVLGGLVLRKSFADSAEITSFCTRIISCLEKAKAKVPDARSLPMHGCALAVGPDRKMECIARQHMQKNGSDRPSLPLPRKITVIKTS